MIFLNISSDKVHIIDSYWELFIDRKAIESHLWPELIKRYHTYPFDEILVVNWPWWFTNLRVWALVVNTISWLLDHEHIDTKLFSISKLALFDFFYKKSILPRYGAIYLWQRENIWLYDFVSSTYQSIKIDGIPWDGDLFLDLVYDDYRPWDTSHMIGFEMTNSWLMFRFKQNLYPIDIEQLALKSQSLIVPQYFIPAVW